MMALQDHQQISSYYRIVDVDMIRRMFVLPWYKRIDWYGILGGTFGFWFCFAAWTGLIEGYLHRRAIVGWFLELEYLQWTSLLLLVAGLVMLGRWVYTKRGA